MKVSINRKDKTKALIFATSKEDKDTLMMLYHNKIIFGLWKIWTLNEDSPENGNHDKEVAFLRSRLPELTGIGWLNIVEGFIPLESVQKLGEAEEFELKY